jgi:glycerol-3-phosphate dehydrogenase
MALDPQRTLRPEILARLTTAQQFDLIVVGGGATGLGIAVDAATRGLSVALIEAYDFAKGTSSRSTKLVHGGVRYLAQGNISLVREALEERSLLLRNAPHLAQPLRFLMPSYRRWERPFYGVGLMAYDALAGKAGLGKTEFVSRADTERSLPNLKTEGLRGAVQYWDGQFDDARLAIALARTAASLGAVVINYCAAEHLLHEGERLTGVRARDAESGRTFDLKAACVINATGVWVDQLNLQDAQATGRLERSMVTPSQGVHLVVDRDFLPGDHALIIPRTDDGRVLFAVPWLGKILLGTTDTELASMPLEPTPLHTEVDFILSQSARVLTRAPKRSDVRSCWAGLRPLVKRSEDNDQRSSGISREHTIKLSPSGLVTITGGKWTTYRAMAEEVLDACVKQEFLRPKQQGGTRTMPLIGAPAEPVNHRLIDVPSLGMYGSEANLVASLPGAQKHLHEGLTEAMVRFAARYEYARTVEDVLARRSRMLFLDAHRAIELAPQIHQILGEELGQPGGGLDPFLQLARSVMTAP